MSTGLDAIQALAASRLAANTQLAGLDVLLELDPTATPDQLAQNEARFETALATKGVALIVLAPHAITLDKTDHAAVHLDVIVPVAICENPEVNRGTANPNATPPRAPANLPGTKLLELAIAALASEFRFQPQPFGRPEFGDGYWAYYLLAQRRHVIRAS